jgi:hypothetical protein
VSIKKQPHRIPNMENFHFVLLADLLQTNGKKNVFIAILADSDEI